MRETAQMKDLSAHARDESEVCNALHKASTARQRERPRPQSLCSRAGQCSTQRVYFRHLCRVKIVKPANSLSILKNISRPLPLSSKVRPAAPRIWAVAHWAALEETA